MESQPLTSALFIEVMSQTREYVKGGHDRVRASVNDLRGDVRTSHLKLDKLSTEVAIIQQARISEKEASASRKQDQRERTALWASLTSVVVTVGLFIIKAVMKW